jgi:type IV pilus assembly protein PilC
MEFRCRLAASSGEVTEGVYVAESESRLRHDLAEKGMYVLSMRPKGSLGGLLFRLPSRTRLSTREFLMFNQELATLLKAGMPLVQSLDLLRGRIDTPGFRAVLDDVHDRVRAGSALSDAFAAHGDLFPSVYTASLLAGERSGSLETVLRRFVEYTRVIDTVKRKAISALIYPAVLTTLAVGLVGLIVLWVVPAFTDFYSSFDAELPLATRAIVAVSLFARDQIVWVFLGLVAVAGACATWVRRPGQRVRFDRYLLRVPVVGGVAQKFATSQMARTLATLLGGGLPLVNALDIATRSVGNQFIARELEVVGGRVREGASFAAALEARGVFPDVAVKMAEVGESTGALQDMLNTVADFYDEEIATSMGRFVALVEPTLLIIMGLVIAGLLLALYMPLIQLSSVLA